MAAFLTENILNFWLKNQMNIFNYESTSSMQSLSVVNINAYDTWRVIPSEKVNNYDTLLSTQFTAIVVFIHIFFFFV